MISLKNSDVFWKKKGGTMQMKTNIEILVCIFLSLSFFQLVYETSLFSL